MSETCPRCGKGREAGEDFSQFPYRYDEAYCQWHSIWVCEKCLVFLTEDRARKKKEADREEAISVLGGLRAYNEFTLARYDRPELIKKCAEYPKINLFLWGAAGVGKTHLATALIRDHDVYGRYSPQEISRTIRKSFGDVDKEEEAYSSIINSPQLLIDDIGTEKQTEFLYSCMYEIIDRRYMQDSGGLILTSNLSLDKLAAHFGDDRLTSRIAGMCKIIEITGKDRRLGRQVTAGGQ